MGLSPSSTREVDEKKRKGGEGSEKNVEEIDKKGLKKILAEFYNQEYLEEEYKSRTNLEAIHKELFDQKELDNIKEIRENSSPFSFSSIFFHLLFSCSLFMKIFFFPFFFKQSASTFLSRTRKDCWPSLQSVWRATWRMWEQRILESKWETRSFTG